MGKNLKVESAGKASTRERMVITPQDIMQRVVSVKKSILKRCRRPRIGLMMQNTKIGTT